MISPLRILANHADDIIRQIIYAMDGATAGVQHDVVTIQFILMYHFLPHHSVKIYLHSKRAVCYSPFPILSHV